MKVILKSIGRCAVAALIAVGLLQMISPRSAQAQTVVNSLFGEPSATQAPNGYVQCPQTTPQIGWTFGCPQNIYTSGVQINSSALGAPAAPPGHQTAWIKNLGTISQTIEFQNSGSYTLTFYLSGHALTPPPEAIEPLLVTIQSEGAPSNQILSASVSANSSSSFNPVSLKFSIPSPGKYVLQFTNGQSVYCHNCINFFYEVAIQPVPAPVTPAPEITKGPDGDLDPTSTVTLTVKNAGNGNGKVRIYFSPASTVAFDNSPFQDKLDLKVPGTWTDNGTITTEQILRASSRGDVSEQTVNITVIAADGKESDPVQATFHNKAVITGVSGVMAPGGNFIVKGWDFGSHRGTVTAQFLAQSYVPFPDSNGSKTNLHVTILSWSPAAIDAQFQSSITGVMEQVPLISLTTKDGRQSNVFPGGIFTPTMQLVQLPQGYVTTSACGTDSHDNYCNGYQNNGGGVCLPPSTWTASGQAPPPDPYVNWPLSSLYGDHYHCYSAASANGVDTYLVALRNGWIIDSVFVWPPASNDSTWTLNGSVSYQLIPLTSPPSMIILNVSWHIGATGGDVNYEAFITIKGPKGVPSN